MSKEKKLSLLLLIILLFSLFPLNISSKRAGDTDEVTQKAIVSIPSDVTSMTAALENNSPTSLDQSSSVSSGTFSRSFQ